MQNFALKSLRWVTISYFYDSIVNNLDEVIEKFPEASLSDSLTAFMLHRKKVSKQSRAVDGTVDLGDFGKGKEILPFQKAGLEFLELTGGRAIMLMIWD